MFQEITSNSIREFLIGHLTKIEDERDTVLKEYYPGVSLKSIEFEKMIEHYISSIKNCITNVQAASDEPAQIPFVLIGSIVDIQDLDDQKVETIQIVSPFLNQGQINYTFASYLSPMGRELLLKRKGDKFSVKLPVGFSHYMVNDFRFSN